MDSDEQNCVAAYVFTNVGVWIRVLLDFSFHIHARFTYVEDSISVVRTASEFELPRHGLSAMAEREESAGRKVCREGLRQVAMDCQPRCEYVPKRPRFFGIRAANIEVKVRRPAAQDHSDVQLQRHG